MASIYIIPTIETIKDAQSPIHSVELTLFNGAHKVGEAKLVMFDYNEIRENGQRLENVARHLSEDMHFTMNALSKHSLFAYEILCDTNRMYCRVPIIAYLARLYVYPEYRGKGYGKAFVKMLPETIKSLTFSYPLAICVYVCPQTKMMTHTGEVVDIPKKDLRAMQKQMENMFSKTGYIKPSKTLNHKRCMVWTEKCL